MRVKKLKDAQRLLSRLITEFQLGNIESRWAKDLRYLVSTFVQMAKESDFEERLRRLEEHANSLQQQKRGPSCETKSPGSMPSSGD